MRSDYEDKLEAETDRLLSQMREMEAPGSLLPRVLAAIERRTALPWYRLPWQAWRIELRIVSLALLLGAFGCLCVACWQLTRAAGFEIAMQEVGKVFSGVSLIWNTILVLLGAVGQVIKHFGTPVILASMLIIGFGYAVCLGLGTVYFRLALARR